MPSNQTLFHLFSVFPNDDTILQQINVKNYLHGIYFFSMGFLS